MDNPEGGLFEKLDGEDIYDRFISLLPHNLQIQNATILHEPEKFPFLKIYSIKSTAWISMVQILAESQVVEVFSL